MSLLLIFQGAPAEVVAVVPIIFSDQALRRGQCASASLVGATSTEQALAMGQGSAQTVAAGSGATSGLVRGSGGGSTKAP